VVGSAFAGVGLWWLLFVGVFDVGSGGRLDLRGLRSGELRAGHLAGTDAGGHRFEGGGGPLGVLDVAGVVGELLAELVFGVELGELLGVVLFLLNEPGGSARREFGGVTVAALGGESEANRGRQR
jgi:hypothetical protein